MAASPTDLEAARRAAIAQVAPGTVLRDGLERILRGRTGGLLVLGHDRTVETMASGGFSLDVDFSAQRLRELSKMDGAVICDRDATKLMRAAVQLLPDPTIATDEQGTRHRTADRVAKQTGFPVISVSKSMNTIALYFGGRRYVLENSGQILARANQALATLERYKMRLDEVSGTLSALDGVGPQDLDLDRLVMRAAEPGVVEVILAVNATVDGQTTAHYITDMLSHLPVKVTRLAHGVPVGGELDYLDEGTLTAAFRQRTRV